MFGKFSLCDRLSHHLMPVSGNISHCGLLARHVVGALLASSLLAATVSAGISLPQYTLTDLGTLPGTTTSVANALNDGGEVVGWSGFQGGSSTAFLYSGGAMQNLGSGLNGSSEATGINATGQVVGHSTQEQAFVYAGASLQILPGLSGRALGINNRGQIVGGYMPPDTNWHAFLYSDGTLHDLGVAGASDTVATAINSSGEVVGYTDGVGGNSQAFVYQAGTIRPVGTPGGGLPYSHAWAVNDSGQIVGDSTNAAGQSHAFLYDSGTMQDLGALGPFASVAIGINNSGEVVGSSGGKGFLYISGTMYDLNELTVDDPGYLITSAAAINASGQIAADAITPSGQEHAVLLSPTAIPLPPAAWAALSAVPLLLSRRFRHAFAGFTRH
jgi:probable HAF family extracellular repeat protein